MEKDILFGKGIPEEAIAFFRSYQKSLGIDEKWSREKNGRFAQNFRYYMLEGLQKNIPSLDLLVAGAILLSHEESYIRRVQEEDRDDSIARHELARTRERVLALAKYMSENGAFLVIPHCVLFSKIRLKLRLSGFEFSGERRRRSCRDYLKFFCDFPVIWQKEEKAA